MIETIISWYAPHYCLGCDAEGPLLCNECANALPVVADRCYRCRALSPASRTCIRCRQQSRLYAVQAVTGYESVAKKLVGRLKFSGARDAAQHIAGAMFGLQLPADAIFVHVPTATGRIRLRGYDQAALVAKQLAHLCAEEYVCCLHRIGQNRQVGASRTVRLAQMKDSFEVLKPARVAGRHIVLVDDVMTTGATLEAAAAVLKAAGAKRVEAIVFARA